MCSFILVLLSICLLPASLASTLPQDAADRSSLFGRADDCSQITSNECDCSGTGFVSCDVTGDGWAIGLNNDTTMAPTTTSSLTPIQTSSTTPSASTQSASQPPPSGPCGDDCTAIIPQLSTYGDLICTGSDLSNFIDHGTTTDANGEADWFRVSSHNNCYLVMAKSAAHRGFPDQYCFQKSAIVNFINQNALGCNAGDVFNRMSGAQASQSQFTGLGEVCLSNFKNYQTCGEKDL